MKAILKTNFDASFGGYNVSIEDEQGRKLAQQRCSSSNLATERLNLSQAFKFAEAAKYYAAWSNDGWSVWTKGELDAIEIRIFGADPGAEENAKLYAEQLNIETAKTDLRTEPTAKEFASAAAVIRFSDVQVDLQENIKALKSWAEGKSHEECVKHLKGKEGIENPWALCNWLKG